MGGEEYGDGGNNRLEAASTVREPRPPERVAIGELFGGAGVRLIMVGVSTFAASCSQQREILSENKLWVIRLVVLIHVLDLPVKEMDKFFNMYI